MSKHRLALLAWGVSFVGNPYLACSSSQDSAFTYSEADMKSASLGSWQGSTELDGVSTPFSLVIEQASSKAKTQSVTPGVRPPCGSRSFVKPAGACVSESTMPIVGSLSSENPLLNGAFDGTLVAYRTLEAIELELRLDSGVVLSGRIKDQALSEGLLDAAGQTSSFSLTRP
jgi:hypothetical protein